MAHKPHLLRLFTDGAYSRKETFGAAAFVVIRGDYDNPLDPVVAEWSQAYKNTTGNRLELLAAIAAINWANESKPRSRAILYSDSKYVVNMEYWIPHWNVCGWASRYGEVVANLDLVLALYAALERRKKVGHFVWVKGHSGHVWNERAHILAANAKEKGCYEDDLGNPSPLTVSDIAKLVDSEHVNTAIRYGIR